MMGNTFGGAYLARVVVVIIIIIIIIIIIDIRSEALTAAKVHKISDCQPCQLVKITDI
jgi:divalent metal cation (Fe/Co/Zn/Cd) transporter